MNEQSTRREFLGSAGIAGAAGMAGVAGLLGPSAAAAAVASAARTTSKNGWGAGLEGPYIDLRTGRGNQLAYARIQGDLDFGKQKYFWFDQYDAFCQ